MTLAHDRAATRPAPSSPARRRALAAIAGLAAASTSPTTSAQAWPGGKTVRIVSPSVAGGGTDILTRAFADWLSKEIGTQVIVDNRPGANGMVATGETARAQPDGHTLLISYAGATVANKLLLAKPPVDPLDLTPIGQMGTAGGIVLVNQDLPVKTMQELVAYAKTRPGMSYGSWGVGSGGHLVMEYAKQLTGIQINHVPYKSSAQIPPDLISNVIPVATMDSATPIPHIRAGRIRAIAVIAQARLPQIPEVPTLSEQGIPYSSPSWWGLFGPRGMPRDVTDRINGLLGRWLALPETVAYFEQKLNSPRPVAMTPAEYQKSIEVDLVNWKRLIDAAGLKPQ